MMGKAFLKSVFVGGISVFILTSGPIFANPPYVHWHPGEFPPSYYWGIGPGAPDDTDIISFSGPTEVFANDCIASGNCGGNVMLTVDYNSLIIELWFQPPPPIYCPYYWNPVCGLAGNFGPLPEGNWLFFSNNPNTFFSIPFYVSSTDSITLLKPEPDEAILAGSSYTIQWSDSRYTEDCLGSYNLEYSINGGNDWFAIDTNSVCGQCSYEWSVPSVDSNQCLVRVTDINNANLTDTSGTFYIYQCQVEFASDLDNDCYVNIKDFALFANQWCLCGNPYDEACWP
jgi:hypothetical protein